MSARVLLVDDLEANRKLLELKLRKEYYEVITASGGEEALTRARTEQPDIILLDVMMPGMDGFETCRRLKEDPFTTHIPVVFVSALDERVDKVRGLDLGAEDFLTKPVDHAQLMARMRSLARLKVVIDELRRREASGRRMGVIDGRVQREDGLGGIVLVIDECPRQAGLITRALEGQQRTIMGGLLADASAPPGPRPDIAMVSLAARQFDGLKVVAHLRSTEATRQMPILVVCEPDDPTRAMRALDLGANDVIYRPIDQEELQARARTMIKRRRYIEAIRAMLDQSLELAVTDQLTGLNNRRYLMGQLASLVHRAARGGEQVAVILADIDYFKRINDGFGHDVGDEVLQEFAARLASNFRPIDMPCRFGGEEFVVVMPNTNADYAVLVAERLRRHIAAAPFTIRDGRESLPVTVSLGVAATAGPHDTVDALLKRADEALYRAKSQGRNRVEAQAA